ncbi:MAG TPA: hypothetical protein VGW57_10130 [Chthoniobacterales bacterium]|nr:hypothetical protein [Chthoniobacterales bacterium]
MKTKHITLMASAAVLFLAFTPLLQADDAKDKLEKAKNTANNIKQAEPPKVSTTTTRTAEQAAKEYKDSGRPSGPQTVKVKEVPLPKQAPNPTRDKDVQKGIDGYKKPDKSKDKQ